MDDRELAAIREREQKATPGPWHAWYRESAGWAIGTAKRYERRMNSDIADISFYQCRPGHDGGPFYTDEGRERDRAEAEFIAHAREDIPVLLAENDRLRQELQQAQAREGAYREALETILRKHADIKNHGYYPSTTSICVEALSGGRGRGEVKCRPESCRTCTFYDETLEDDPCSVARRIKSDMPVVWQGKAKIIYPEGQAAITQEGGEADG